MDNGWITTLRLDGSPRLARVWFVELDGDIWVASGESSFKVADIRRDERVAFAVEGRHGGLSGRAVIVAIHTRADILCLLTDRYNGWDAADPTVDGPRVLICVRPR